MTDDADRPVDETSAVKTLDEMNARDLQFELLLTRVERLESVVEDLGRRLHRLIDLYYKLEDRTAGREAEPATKV
jgi:hypothetical protein